MLKIINYIKTTRIYKYEFVRKIYVHSVMAFFVVFMFTICTIDTNLDDRQRQQCFVVFACFLGLYLIMLLDTFVPDTSQETRLNRWILSHIVMHELHYRPRLLVKHIK